MWMNGISPFINLPETAQPDAVIAECLKHTVKTYKIIQMREVKIHIQIRGAREEFHAALVDSDLGKKIVLFQYQGSTVGWWTRVYDVK